MRIEAANPSGLSAEPWQSILTSRCSILLVRAGVSTSLLNKLVKYEG